MFESFSLSTTIADTCPNKTNTPANRQCAYDYGGAMIFLNGMTNICEIEIEDGSEMFDSLCYHVPTLTTSLFNS